MENSTDISKMKAIIENSHIRYSSNSKSELEDILAENILKIFQNKNLYSLQTTTISNIINKIEFDVIDNPTHVIKTILKNAMNSYPESWHFFLQNINPEILGFNLNEYMDILQCFTKCPYLVYVSHLYQKMLSLPSRDYDYEMISQEFAPVNIKPFTYKNIITAVTTGNLQDVQYYYENVYNKEDPNSLSPSASLIISSQKSNFIVTKYLIEKQKADVNTSYEDTKTVLKGTTPLINACFALNFPLIEYLISKGANVNVRTKYGLSSLLFLCFSGDTKLLKCLIGHGAKIDNYENDRNIIHDICGSIFSRENESKSLIESAKFFIKKGLDINSKDANNITPFMLGCKHRDAQFISFLVKELSADTRSIDFDGLTALHYAASNTSSNSIDILKFLLEQCNLKDLINNHSAKHESPLFLAVKYTTNTEVVKYLLDQGANVNIQCSSGNTALIEAALLNKVEIVNILIQYKADKDAKNNEGKRAIDVASSKQIKRLLSPKMFFGLF